MLLIATFFLVSCAPTKSFKVERIDGAVESLVEGDIAQNNEFRIKWPRGDLGSPPADSEQFMLIEFLSGQVESLQTQLKGIMNNQVNIERLQTDMEKSLEDIEKLKDKIRDQKNGGIE